MPGVVDNDEEAGSGQTASVFDLQIMPTQAYRKLTKNDTNGSEAEPLHPRSVLDQCGWRW
jgi:hypothetical protein